MRDEAHLFNDAIVALRAKLPNPEGLFDSSATDKWRAWLGPDLPWLRSDITEDEWFFATTLCGTMNLAGQRTHIRTFFPRFAALDSRIERCTAELLSPWRLRYPWMKVRLARMGALLRQRGIGMSSYVRDLRNFERAAVASNLMPALVCVSNDLRATQRKTLGLFVRDCVFGNCFPIDSRVRTCLQHFGLPEDEQLLVSLCVELGENPRHIARLFYDGHDGGTFFGA